MTLRASAVGDAAVRLANAGAGELEPVLSRHRRWRGEPGSAEALREAAAAIEAEANEFLAMSGRLAAYAARLAEHYRNAAHDAARAARVEAEGNGPEATGYRTREPRAGELSQPFACRACGQQLRLAPTRHGKRMPVNVSDGQPHWVTCTDPKRFRNRG